MRQIVNGYYANPARIPCAESIPRHRIVLRQTALDDAKLGFSTVESAYGAAISIRSAHASECNSARA